MPVYDYRCKHGHNTEHRCKIAERPEAVTCSRCGEEAAFGIFDCPALPTTIVVDYPGSKKKKAGYVHSHGDFPAEKVQVGFGGKVSHRQEEVAEWRRNNPWEAEQK